MKHVLMAIGIHTSESKDELRSVITDGSDFWGDHILLQLLQKKLEVNIIILNSDNNIETQNIDERFTVHPSFTLI